MFFEEGERCFEVGLVACEHSGEDGGGVLLAHLAVVQRLGQVLFQGVVVSGASQRAQDEYLLAGGRVGGLVTLPQEVPVLPPALPQPRAIHRALLAGFNAAITRDNDSGLCGGETEDAAVLRLDDDALLGAVCLEGLEGRGGVPLAVLVSQPAGLAQQGGPEGELEVVVAGDLVKAHVLVHGVHQFQRVCLQQSAYPATVSVSPLAAKVQV